MKKRIFSIIALCSIAIGGSTIAKASVTRDNEISKRESWGSYDFTVPMISDSETSSIVKETNFSAKNEVNYIERGALRAWVESKTLGLNVTEEVEYSTTGTKTMEFKTGTVTQGSALHLNISTSSDTLQSVGTRGRWTP